MAASAARRPSAVHPIGGRAEPPRHARHRWVRPARLVSRPGRLRAGAAWPRPPPRLPVRVADSSGLFRSSARRAPEGPTQRALLSLHCTPPAERSPRVPCLRDRASLNPRCLPALASNLAPVRPLKAVRQPRPKWMSRCRAAALASQWLRPAPRLGRRCDRTAGTGRLPAMSDRGAFPSPPPLHRPPFSCAYATTSYRRRPRFGWDAILAASRYKQAPEGVYG